MGGVVTKRAAAMAAVVTLCTLGVTPHQTASDSYRRIVTFESARLASPALFAYLASPNPRLQVRAALALGRTKRPEALADLRLHANDRDIAVRAMAIYAIGLIGGADAVQTAVAALLDPADAVRVAALDAVGRLADGRSLSVGQAAVTVRRLGALLRNGSPIVRARSALALEAFGGGASAADAQQALEGAYSSETDPVVRRRVMWALYRGFATTASANILRAGLADRDEVVRIEAVRAFGRRAQPFAAALLEPLRNDPSWRVQEQTLESLAVLHGGAATEHFKAIPALVHLPPAQRDALASLPAWPRSPAKRPSRPTPQGIITEPHLYPTTASLMTGPANSAHPRMRIATTKGNIYLELYPEWAPMTVENFLRLANAGYYDDNPWFRIVPDFVVQSGDPSGNGNGDAGYSIPAEENPIDQDSGAVSMGLNYTDPPNAHAIRDSAGTQFYITLSPQWHLDGSFTVFGRVIGGDWVLSRLVESDKILRVERIADSAP